MRIAAVVSIAVVCVGLIWIKVYVLPEDPVATKEIPVQAEAQVKAQNTINPHHEGELDRDIEQRGQKAASSDQHKKTKIEPLRLKVSSDRELSRQLEAHGFKNFEHRLTKWFHDHGFKAGDDIPLVLEQPYEQFDEDMLRAFAENNDMWAAQTLGDRLKTSEPAEARHWYQRAAISGSVNAMDQLTSMYSSLDRSGGGIDANPEFYTGYDEQVLSMLKDYYPAEQFSIAWSAVAALEGAGAGLGFEGFSELGPVPKEWQENSLSNACKLASILHSNIVAERRAKGIERSSNKVSPLLMGSMEQVTNLPCRDILEFPVVSSSHCQEVELEFEDTSRFTAVLCNDID